MYVIAQCTGKGFIEKSRKFTISGYGNVWELDDSVHAQRWAEEQERNHTIPVMNRNILTKTNLPIRSLNLN
jgi:hypothetical protein